jgi:hypothetical protein
VTSKEFCHKSATEDTESTEEKRGKQLRRKEKPLLIFFKTLFCLRVFVVFLFYQFDSFFFAPSRLSG